MMGVKILIMMVVVVMMMAEKVMPGVVRMMLAELLLCAVCSIPVTMQSNVPNTLHQTKLATD